MKDQEIQIYCHMTTKILFWIFLDLYMFENSIDYLQKPINTTNFERITRISIIILPIIVVLGIGQSILGCIFQKTCKKNDLIKTTIIEWKKLNKKINIIMLVSQICSIILGLAFFFVYLFALVNLYIPLLTCLKISILTYHTINFSKKLYISKHQSYNSVDEKDNLVIHEVEPSLQIAQ
ncbi:Hypothetical_protein [Hexamita inflata]|uniref:Hypothetical_protein n=1 Tax=Hexamita inflata TaxID=28002 RepID=A0AA86R2M6_9EUKA|nr:Hypothetical protein HINF_LOCUS56885 [Hexamita inflata]